VCLSLKSALQGDTSCALVQPEFHLLISAVPVLFAFDPVAAEQIASFSRQAQRHNLVLTPEVSLGPAFRSLAPPTFV